MENLSPLSIVSLFDTTKEERNKFVSLALGQIIDGFTEIKSVHYSIKCLEQIIKEIQDAPIYKDMLIESVALEGGKMKFKNSELSVAEAGVKYIYSNCNDYTLNQLMEQVEVLQKNIKERQEFLKKIPAKGLDVVDPSTGELVTIYPPAKESTTIVKTKLL